MEYSYDSYISYGGSFISYILISRTGPVLVFWTIPFMHRQILKKQAFVIRNKK
jgi:hypothetical protein